MKDRIVKNWKTTLLGTFIALAGVALIWHEKITLLELGGFIGTALIPILYKKKS